LNNLAINGIDVGQLASAAVQLSGFTPSFSNSFTGRLSTSTALSSNRYNKKNSRIGAATRSDPKETYVDTIVKCCEFGIHHLIECDSRSSVVDSTLRTESTDSALGNSSSSSSSQAPPGESQGRKVFLCLETERGVYVYYPLLKDRADSLRGPSRGSNQSDYSSDVSSSSSSWKQRSGKNKNGDESRTFRNVGGTKKHQDTRLAFSRRIEDNNDYDTLEEDNEEDDEEEDGGMWRDKDSEDEDSAEEYDEGNNRLAEKSRIETRNMGHIERGNFSESNDGHTLRQKRSAAKAGKSQAVSVPPFGALWKLLSPSLHGIDVGESVSPSCASYAAEFSATSLDYSLFLSLSVYLCYWPSFYSLSAFFIAI
jgi:hypothetical protein